MSILNNFNSIINNKINSLTINMIGCYIITSCSTKIIDVVYILPDNYQGNVCIIFNQPTGRASEYAGKTRIYRIPVNGLLRTQFESNHGSYSVITYCYSSQFKLNKVATALSYVNVLTSNVISRLPADSVVCYENVPISQGATTGELFSVSKIDKADSISSLREKFMFNSFNE